MAEPLTGQCRKCLREKPLRARGMCATCYGHAAEIGFADKSTRGRPSNHDKAIKGLSRGCVQPGQESASPLSDIELIMASEIGRTTSMGNHRMHELKWHEVPLIVTGIV